MAKKFINIISYDNAITTRALLIGAYGSMQLPEAYEAAAQRGDLAWAIERAGFDSTRGPVAKGFKTLREATAAANNLRRCIDIGQGMLKGAGLIEQRVFDEVKIS